MLAQKIHTHLVLLALAAMPATGALAQRASHAAVPEQPVSAHMAAAEADAISETRAAPTLPAGTVITVLVTDTVSSRYHEVGKQISARVATSMFDAGNDLVIPADAVVRGVITDISSEDGGRIEFTFYGVEFGGRRYPLQVRVISLPTRKQRRGNTAGDVAKVGAGAILGGVAGRIIGGNAKGTIIGGVTGAAAGVGVAAGTRKDDIVVDAGAPILLMLTTPFVL